MLKTERVIQVDLVQVAQMSEEEARAYFEHYLWPHGPVCPHCGFLKVYELKGKSTRPGTYKCSGCRKKFTVTTKTIMHKTHISLVKWLLAMYLMLSSRKGISALQLMRDLGLGSYKSAWFLEHRIREAMSVEEHGDKLLGIVEADETYVGGKSHFSGRSLGNKRVVLVAVEREGLVRAKVAENARIASIEPFLKENVDRFSILMTDEWPSYRWTSKYFCAHGVIPHKRKIYGVGKIYTNTAESFNAVLKRSYKGIYHWMSFKYLQRYCNEIVYRWNHNKQKVEECLDDLIYKCKGKRITMNSLVRGIVEPGKLLSLDLQQGQ